MQCPKCFGDMDTVNQDGENELRIDRCQECHGLYFDQLTQSDLVLVEGKTALDSEDDDVGAEYDDTVYVDCPKCDRIMDQRKIEEPVAIRFEHCPTCYATFLDAGEFRQYLSEAYRVEFQALLPE